MKRTPSSPRTGPQDLLALHYDCEENEQKTLLKNAINQVINAEPQETETTVIISNGNKNRLGHESFYQSNVETLLHLSPEDCKNELNRLKLTTNKSINRKNNNSSNCKADTKNERYQEIMFFDRKIQLEKFS